jgi:hypothetical protein
MLRMDVSVGCGNRSDVGIVSSILVLMRLIVVSAFKIGVRTIVKICIDIWSFNRCEN